MNRSSLYVKLLTSICMFWRKSKFLPEKARIAYGNGCILSHLDYCNTVWGNTTKTNLDRLHRLQKRAARLIFDDYISPSSELLRKLHWLPFAERVNHNKAVMMYKCMNNRTPSYLQNMFSPQSNSRYKLRSEEHRNLSVPRPRIEMYKNSFSYSGAKIWNSLPTNVRNSDNLNVFKRKINSQTNWVPSRSNLKYYWIHVPLLCYVVYSMYVYCLCIYLFCLVYCLVVLIQSSEHLMEDCVCINSIVYCVCTVQMSICSINMVYYYYYYYWHSHCIFTTRLNKLFL